MNATALVTVYHDPLMFAGRETASESPGSRFYAGRFDPVAVVTLTVLESADAMLEAAFEATNSIDAPWWHNACVTKTFAGRGCRSTCVGDFLVLSMPDKPAEAYRVAPAGFQQIECPAYAERAAQEARA